MTRQEVYALIDGERAYQEYVWPPAHSEKHVPTEFAVYMQDYINEALHNVSRNPGYNGLLEGVRKVTALGVACMELFGAPPRSQESISRAASRPPKGV